MASQDKKALEDVVLAGTHEMLSQPDWAVNMQLVDVLNGQSAQGEVVVKAIKKRLEHKKNSVALLAITLLDTLVKSCPSFHKYVGNKDFMTFFVKTLPKRVRDPQKKDKNSVKDQPDVNEMERVDRTLLLIETWARAFAQSKSYPAFRECYDELLSKGVKFPQPLKDELAPVFTPPAHDKPKEVAKTEAPKKPVDPGFRDAECRAAAENARLLVEMLTASEPGSDLTRNDLIQMLVTNVKQSIASGMSRLTQPVAQNLLDEILRANDLLHDAAAYHEGLVRGTMKRRLREVVIAQVVQQPKPEAAKRDNKPTPSKLEPPVESKALPQVVQTQPQQPATANILDFLSLGGPSTSTQPSAVVTPQLVQPQATPQIQQQSTPVKNAVSDKADQKTVAPTADFPQAMNIKVGPAPPKLDPPPPTPTGTKPSRGMRSPQINPTSISSNTNKPTASPQATGQTTGTAPNDLGFGFLLDAMNPGPKPTQSQPVAPAVQSFDPFGTAKAQAQTQADDEEEEDPFASLAMRKTGAGSTSSPQVLSKVQPQQQPHLFQPQILSFPPQATSKPQVQVQPQPKQEEEDEEDEFAALANRR